MALDAEDFQRMQVRMDLLIIIIDIYLRKITLYFLNNQVHTISKYISGTSIGVKEPKLRFRR